MLFCNMNEKDNYIFLENLTKLSQEIEAGYLDFAKGLQECRDQERYKPLHEDFSDFLEELKLSSGKASKLINIYQKFVIEYGIPKEELAQLGGWSVIAEVLPVVKDKKTALDWVEKAKLLRRGDLRKEVKEEKTGIPMGKCTHKDTYMVEICRGCGDSWRKYND